MLISNIDENEIVLFLLSLVSLLINNNVNSSKDPGCPVLQTKVSAAVLSSAFCSLVHLMCNNASRRTSLDRLN